jgi:hypothetical protein
MMEDKPCCAGEALRRIKQIRINGLPTGIAMLEKTISEVKVRNIRDRTQLKKELMDRVKIYNYIPTGAYEAYADAVLAEYLKAIEEREGFG